MDNYSHFRSAILKDNSDLPESYIRSLYDHYSDPHHVVYRDIWYKEHDKLRQSKKRQFKYCDTIPDLIECALLNIKDRLKSKNRSTHDHLE